MSRLMARAPSHRLSVGQWLVLLVVVLFVSPLLISNLWGYLRTRQHLTTTALHSTRDLAALAVAEVDDFVLAAKTVAERIARDAELVHAVADADRARVAPLVARTASVVPDLDKLQVVTTTGELLATSGGATEAPDLTSAMCLQRGRTRTDVLAGRADDPAMVVASPIRSGERVVGVVCMRLRHGTERLLARLQRRSAGARVYVLAHDDTVILGTGVEPGARPPWPIDLTEESRVVRVRVAGLGELSLGHARIPSTTWSAVVALPIDTVLADLEDLKWQAIGVFASLMAVVALAVVLAWRTLVRPLRALAATSGEIASGATGATVSETGPREISELASEFNRMSLALRDARQHLEDRIAARTHELQDSEQFLEQLVNSIEQRVVVTDTAYRIIKSNAAAERLHRREGRASLVGAHCYRAFEERDAVCDDCPARRTLATGEPATIERSQQTATGPEVMAIATYPVRDREGHVQSIISISRIVTKEKQLQAQLTFQEKMAAFGQLAAGVAHELGNPLASIDSQLQRAEADSSRALRSVPIVRKEVGRMSRMLRELVDFARRKRDEVRLVSPDQVIDDVLRLLEHDPRARNAEIVHAPSSSVPGVRLVEDHLVQVLLNLGLNALDALVHGGTLVLSAQAVADARFVEIRVSDTGGGVPPEIRGQLFQPFRTTKAAGRGTGLGLFVSKRIIEDMGGALELESTGPTGSVFVVRVPIEPTKPEVT